MCSAERTEQQPIDGQPRSPQPQITAVRKRRPRARRACLPCRARRVRCDVTQQSPCSNCQWTKSNCVVVGRRRWQYTSHPECEEDEPYSPKSGELPSPHRTPAGQDHVHHDRVFTELESADVSYKSTDEVLPALHQLKPGEPFSPHHLSHEPIPIPVTPKVSLHPPFEDLPRFIEPLTMPVAVDDMTYLQLKGALTLPSRECQEHLIWCFFEYVYPLMPIIDLDAFAQALESPGGNSGKISLLLFQAVLFAGAAHAKLAQLREAGFSTQEEARKMLFQRVKLVYDLDVETDPLVLAQALTLMASWYEPPEQRRNTWYWAGAAVSQCYVAGLHIEPSRLIPSLPSNTQNLRRRIWWVCLMREQILSLGLRRPQRVSEADCSVLMLKGSDFQSPFQRPKSFQQFCSYANNKTKSDQLAHLCIMMIKLCCCVRQYIPTHDSNKHKAAGGGESNISGLSRNRESCSFADCQDDLLKWRKSLPKRCKTLPLVYSSRNPARPTIILNQMLLEMTYLATIATLHRERLVFSGHDTGKSPFDRELSKLHMQNAASQISSMVQEIHRCCLDSLLPSMAIGILMTAASIHQLELKGIIHAEKQRAVDGFSQCMAVINSLKSIHVASETVKGSMEWISLMNHTSGSQLSESQINSTSYYENSLCVSSGCPDFDTATSPYSSNSNNANGEVLTSLTRNKFEWVEGLDDDSASGSRTLSLGNMDTSHTDVLSYDKQ